MGIFSFKNLVNLFVHVCGYTLLLEIRKELVGVSFLMFDLMEETEILRLDSMCKRHYFLSHHTGLQMDIFCNCFCLYGTKNIYKIYQDKTCNSYWQKLYSQMLIWAHGLF